MTGFGTQLDDYDSVMGQSLLIYDYLASQMMPLGEAAWPAEPLEVFRIWVNDGWRRTSQDPIDRQERIPPPSPQPVDIRIRRDLRSLTAAELDDYRMRLDDRLRIGDPDPAAPGQLFAAVHGDWCLHYQEAFLLWHRAYLMRLEQEIGCAVPYWNWYAADAAAPGTPASGLPQAFIDETYVHPGTGETRPNPLRYAAARGGISKRCAPGQPPPGPGIDCRWVQRDPALLTPGPARDAKIALTLNYQQQVQRALAFQDFSHPELISRTGHVMSGGHPWANIPTFDPPPPDSDYVYRLHDFDGAYEQPHDNYHGWVGPDMADNSYTAYDPVFWSYHANIDRIFEIWLRDNPQATFTATFPLHPFSGPRADRFEFTDPRKFLYTTIGDLARDSRALGYDFAMPVDPDYQAKLFGCPSGRPVQTGLTAATVAEDELLVVFEDVRCTIDSYAIDVFLGVAAPTPADVAATNPHYVGRMSRLGMGRPDERGRCIKTGVTRILDATAAAARLGIATGELPDCAMLVTDLADGRVLAPADLACLPGFAPHLVWAKRGWVPTAARKPVTAASCCSNAEGN